MDDAPCPKSLAPTLTDPLERALVYAEMQALEPLSVDTLADVAQLSPYHFVRQFSARYGLSPMALVRARRLGLAARELAAGRGDSLAGLAFDSGFETQEGFTRAFKRAFGVTPGRYRRARGPSGQETPMTDTAIAPRLTQEAEPRRAEAFRVAGLSGVFEEGAKAGIPDLWDRLGPRLPVPGQDGHQTLGVCWGGGPGGGFHYLAGAKLAPGAAIPEGLEVKEVPAQTYLVFRQTLAGGDLQPQMQAAAKEIWGQRLPASGRKLAAGPDLEVYPDEFHPGQPDQWVEWWIPVEA